jgi:hypothetical protein
MCRTFDFSPSRHQPERVGQLLDCRLGRLERVLIPGMAPYSATKGGTDGK